MTMGERSKVAQGFKPTSISTHPDGVEDDGGEGGLRYQTGIPKVSPGRLNVAITGVPTTPGGGQRKGICVMGDPEHGFPPHDGTEDEGAMDSPDGEDGAPDVDGGVSKG